MELGDIFKLWVEHLYFSLIAISLSIIIGIIISLLVYRKPRVANGINQITGSLQTFPSIALFGVLIPLVNNIPTIVIIALVIYGLFPITTNTIIGLQGLRKETEYSAKAIALNEAEILWYVRIPLGLSSIIGGIRITSTLIIGVTTIAAVIGGGGLGEIILSGISRRDLTLILQGAVPVALTSIAISSACQFAEKAFKTEQL